MEGLRIQLGANAGLTVSTPFLAGAEAESIFASAVPLAGGDGVQLYRQGSLLLGHAREAVVSDHFEAAAEVIYGRVLKTVRGRQLYRVWNYVPRINAISDGLENYRAFCLGRAQAFEREFGAGFPGRLPAASGVGCDGLEIDVIFVAGEIIPAHWENPEQVPAYHYPAEHGPRSPSFARATTVQVDDTDYHFISGTAAIKGHKSVGLESLAAQIEVTVDNLRLIAKTSGVDLDKVAASGKAQRHFKVYLRRTDDLSATRAALENGFLQAHDRVSYVRSDICRAELDVEIEATVVAHDSKKVG